MASYKCQNHFICDSSDQYFYSQMLVAKDNTVVVTSETSCVRVWSLEKEKCLFMFNDFDDYAKIAISQNSQILICYLVGIDTLR